MIRKILRKQSAIKSGKLTYRKASDQFGVPRSTLENKVNDTNPGSIGKPSVLDKAEEDMLIHGILRAAHWGFPFTSDDIRYVVKGYLDKSGRKEKRFAQNLPGMEWSRAFLKRHSNVLSVRLSENIKRQRAEVNHEAVKLYFLNIEEAIVNIPPSNVVNYDETNLCDDPGRKHVIVRRGTKHPERVMDSSKSSVSIMMAASGDGDLLPPYVLYKSEHLWDTWQEGGPKGTRYNRNRSGWFDLPVFEDWFFTIVLPYFKSKEGPKIMVGDNLSSHISLRVIEECERNNISYILLPPNSTHLLQPLDVGFFKPLKNAWRAVLTKWKQTTRGPISKDAFPCLLKDTLDQISTNKKENIQNAFRAVGLIPFNPDKVLNKLPDKEHSPSNSADAWSSSFEEMLKSARSGRNSTTNTRRRRKLNVPPGRSISSRDLRNGGHNDDRGEPTVGNIDLSESPVETRRDSNEGTKRREEDESQKISSCKRRLKSYKRRSRIES
ncbi:hypothetical protein ANN_23362 [Periplaneta americana]|uniref:DDE-1 domain-containing protein n=1 Tax=Periplaneta americana TaxID=6978 RepID=A0ABQ8SLX6_PERAM|nr:hypothetical protein ANN_23362 [Periplaneta americana]